MNETLATIRLENAIKALRRYEMCLVEAKANKPANERKAALIVSKLFKKQGATIITALKRQHGLSEAIDDFIEKGLANVSADEYMPALEALLKKTYLASGVVAAKKYQTGISFSLKNPRAAEYFKDYGVNKLKELNETTKERIKALVADGIENGHSYDRIAKSIKQEFADYAAVPTYGPDHIRSRAQLVAVTEVGNAYQQGNLDAVLSATDTGLEFEKRWSTVGDDRVSDGCQTNQDAGWIDISDPFPSGDDRPLRFPGCRCALEIRRKEGTPAAIEIPKFKAKDYGSIEDADTALVNASSIKRRMLEDDEKGAIDYYQDISGYKSMNGALRSGDLGDEADNIKIMDRVIKLAGSTDNNLMAYRGMVVGAKGDARDLVDSWEVGSTYKEPGYMSTTIDKKVRDNFTEVGTGQNAVNIDIRVPKGSKGVYMNAVAPTNEFSEERELLLARDTKYRILSKTTDEDGNISVLMEIVK